jgi:hypothetical protein
MKGDKESNQSLNPVSATIRPYSAKKNLYAKDLRGI